MGLLRKIAYAFLGLFLVFIAIAFASILMNQAQAPRPGEPYLVRHEPAGIAYGGPPTTAIAGWYCIEYISSAVAGTPASPECAVPVGYSIQLNAQLSNGDWVQDVMNTARGSGGAYSWTYGSMLWVGGKPAGAGGSLLPGPVTCGWLVIAVKNSTAYTGYSLDGRTVTWFSSYPVGNATIVPDFRTDLVLAGPNCGEGIRLNETLTYLAMYYWDGTAWKPAPVGVLYLGGTGEWVEEAWVFTNGSACGVVSWPEPVNETQCPLPPSFSPTPSPT